MNYYEIMDDLQRGLCAPALARRAKAAIQELLTMHECDQTEIVRLRRQIEVLQMEVKQDGEICKKCYDSRVLAETKQARREITPKEG